MRNKMISDLKEDKGITLIALVITIIVLLILAGVAISMLAGENGILRQAKNAKTQTEEAQDAEIQQISDLELITDLKIANKEYIVSNGYITNVQQNTTVKNLDLPSEYKLYKRNGDEANDEDIVTTGAIVKKDGIEKARIIIYGDVNCDGKILANDVLAISQIINNVIKDAEDYRVVAANLDSDDKYLNRNDVQFLQDYLSSVHKITQKKVAVKRSEIIIQKDESE